MPLLATLKHVIIIAAASLSCLFHVSVQAGIGNATPNFYPGSSVKVLFENGELAEQGLVVALANEWTHYANINFEFYFAQQHTLSELSSIEYAANIIVRFADSTDEWRTEGEKAFYNQYRYYGERMLFTQRKHGILITEPTPRVILHEFGHALGLQHEHQHPQAPYSEQLTQKICRKLNWDERECAFNMTKVNSDEPYVFTEYDASSIMHYDFFGDFTDQAYLSVGDAQLIAQMYPGVLNITEDKRNDVAELVKARSTLFLSSLKVTQQRNETFNAWYNNSQGEPLLHFEHRLNNQSGLQFAFTNYALTPAQRIDYMKVPGVTSAQYIGYNEAQQVNRIGPFRILANIPQQPVDNSLDNVFIWRVQSKRENELHLAQLDRQQRLHGIHIIATVNTTDTRAQLHVMQATNGRLTSELKLRPDYLRGLIFDSNNKQVTEYELAQGKCVIHRYTCAEEACLEHNSQPADIDSTHAFIAVQPPQINMPFDEVTYRYINGVRTSSIAHLYRPNTQCTELQYSQLAPVLPTIEHFALQQPLSDVVKKVLKN